MEVLKRRRRVIDLLVSYRPLAHPGASASVGIVRVQEGTLQTCR